MAASIDVLNPDRPKRVLMIVANPAISPTTGWPVGFWAAELTHPWYEFTEHGYQVDIASPRGGAVALDAWSDPRDASGYSAHDLISMGFLSTPALAAQLEDTPAIEDVDLAAYDAIFLCGGQAPMVNMVNDERLHQLIVAAYEAGKVVAVVCHGTAVLLKTRLSSGELLVAGKTWTGFANSEEAFADAFVGTRIQPFWIEDEARKLPDTNFIVAGRFKPFAVRDGRLITGQQQYSGAAAARLVIEALGV
ncbi:MAG: type 1 glutamine amidotransferase domain-containing protein [Chloroflexi bacterium]|nr:MAG: type 1 glutamine amidotransferase domain-containing protein [Chloroflexota bacterium]